MNYQLALGCSAGLLPLEPSQTHPKGFQGHLITDGHLLKALGQLGRDIQLRSNSTVCKVFRADNAHITKFSTLKNFPNRSSN